VGTTTPNYVLFKPDPVNDFVNVVTDINNNMDTLDTQLKAVSNSIRPVLKVLKTANKDKTNDTTLEADNHLFLPVEANLTYSLDAYIRYKGPADPLGGIKFDWTGPAGFSIDWTNFGVLGVGVGTLTSYDVVAETAAGGRFHGTANTATIMSLHFAGTVVIGGTPGTVTLRWAQAAANATPTTLMSNSWLRMEKF
jgi:hypothetical protein